MCGWQVGTTDATYVLWRYCLSTNKLVIFRNVTNILKLEFNIILHMAVHDALKVLDAGTDDMTRELLILCHIGYFHLTLDRLED